METEQLEFQLTPYSDSDPDPFDLDAVLFRLDSQIDLLASHADNMDYIISIASGILCSMLDIFWCGEIDLMAGRKIATDKVDNFVKNVARRKGCENADDLKTAVLFLEGQYHSPSDSNRLDFGGSLQHHLRDLSHHPTIVGLFFSILTQFTQDSYGTNTDGEFCVVAVTAKGKPYIGKDIPEKLVNGTVNWFFHLVSDMAGSGSTAALSGGTGIPGPILSLAKELSMLPFFKNLGSDDTSLSQFLSKLFNGTLLAQHDENGKIIPGTEIRFDLRGELGLGIELAKQAVPVIANECIVRCFYFIRRLAMEMRDKKVRKLADFAAIDWKTVLPASNPTLSRMLTISTGVFTTLDIGEAVVSQKFWVSVNYIGVGRFAVAIGEDVSWCLKSRNLKKLKEMYSKIDRNTYRKTENNIYRKIENDLSDLIDGFGLTEDQTEILYNIEYYKTKHDLETVIAPQNREKLVALKQEWLDEWKDYMEKGFSSFLQSDDAQMAWYSIKDLTKKIEECDPTKPWLRLVLLEAMMFEPYYALDFEENEKGKCVPSKKYNLLKIPGNGYNQSEGDVYLDLMFSGKYCENGFVRRLRKTFDQCTRELSVAIKMTPQNMIKIISISGVVTVAAVATCGALAPAIATALVGSNFAGLSGAALTSACLAYLGGGAIAAGGAGMAGGTAAIVGGGAVLSFAAGSGITGAAEANDLRKEEDTIMQTVKLLVSVREIFLQDEHNPEYAKWVYDQYLEIIQKAEEKIVQLKLQKDVKKGEEKKELNEQIKDLEKTVAGMKAARKNMLKYHSEFEEDETVAAGEDAT